MKSFFTILLSVVASLTLCAVPASAQRLFHADVQTKSVKDGKMKVSDREIYYTKGGNLNVRWNAGLNTYYFLSSPFGFTDVYYPASNESMTLEPSIFKAQDELLWVFAEGGAEDLGLGREGFVLTSSKKDGPHTVRTYVPCQKGGMCIRVELVLDERHLPVYCAYYDKKGKVITKTYLSNYRTEKGFAFPMRVTEISYFMEKSDSTVKLDLYRDLEIDVPNEMYGFHVPSDAKIVDMKEGLKAMKKSAK